MRHFHWQPYLSLDPAPKSSSLANDQSEPTLVLHTQMQYTTENVRLSF